MILPSFSSALINPISRRFFNAGYMVPGLGFSPFLLAISSASSCPCIGLFESKNKIRNPSIPLISQQALPCLNPPIVYDIVCPIYINTSLQYISYIRYGHRRGGEQYGIWLWVLRYSWFSEIKEFSYKRRADRIIKRI